MKEICDRITILRGGRTEGVFNIADVSEQEISRLMVGRDVVLKYDKTQNNYGDPVLSVQHLGAVDAEGKSLLSNISFNVRAGEIVGIAGVEGNGQSQLVEALTGGLTSRLAGGKVEVKGRDIQNLGIREIRGLGVSYIPEDRMRQGAAGEASIADNLISTQYRSKSLNRGPLLRMSSIQKLASSLIQEFKVRCSGPSQPIGMLSGGNMQKVVVARECSTGPLLLIAEQPTRGVDIGAAQFIHQKLLELRDAGCAIVLVSADLNEILEMSDTLLVLYEGEIAARLDSPSSVSEEELGLYMLGIRLQQEQYEEEASP